MGSIYNTSNWAGTTQSYKKNDVVAHSSKFYYCIQDHTSSYDTYKTPGGAGSEANWGGNISVTIDGSSSIQPYFLWSPSYNTQTIHSPRIQSIKFGEGYEQRIKDGINNDLLKFSLSFTNRNEREATAILHFLHSREGYGSFYFKTPAPYSLIKKFVCKEFNSSFIFADNYTVQATFMEVS